MRDVFDKGSFTARVLGMGGAKSSDDRKDAKGETNSRAIEVGSPDAQASVPPKEMSMQDAFAQVFKKMKAGVKMDLREPGDR